MSSWTKGEHIRNRMRLATRTGKLRPRAQVAT
jgi:hypothetical protein